MRQLEDIKNDGKLKILECYPCKEFETDTEDNGIRIVGHLTDPVTRETYLVMFTKQLGWEHASISYTRGKRKCPEWDIMCRLKDMFWGKDECCVQYHPAEEDYVNMHEYTLHVWRPYLESLPKPPSIMVGFKDVTPEQMSLISKAFIDSMSPSEQLAYAKAKGYTINRKSRRKG